MPILADLPPGVLTEIAGFAPGRNSFSIEFIIMIVDRIETLVLEPNRWIPGDASNLTSQWL